MFLRDANAWVVPSVPIDTVYNIKVYMCFAKGRSDGDGPLSLFIDLS